MFTSVTRIRWTIWFALTAVNLVAAAQNEPSQVTVSFTNRLGPLEIDHMALGQGGLSDEPIFADRIRELRALNPRIIRLFIQEYFNLLPEQGRTHFETLDRSVDTILATGAKPLMCICFKPSLLFPTINQDIVEPNDYAAWEKLISDLVRHYRERRAGIVYWEVANEPDIGEDGGCPYRFTPAAYVRYYQHTISAILRADPEAHVGGPALANSRSPILPALLNACDTNRIPLHFVSWHIYNSNPKAVRDTIGHVKALLKSHPTLKPETILNEWNMDLTNPPLDPRYQPCYLSEVIYQMKEAGLDYSCYYHIRDWHVDFDQFDKFMSPRGLAFMARWWNRMPQFDGLFDFQNTPRPSYFAFKLLARLGGERLPVTSTAPAIHGFAAHDDRLRMYNVMLWNFSAKSNQVDVTFSDLPNDLRIRHLTFDALTGSNDENLRLHPAPPARIKQGQHTFSADFEPYGIQFWSLE
jgi:hypothetical protein